MLDAVAVGHLAVDRGLHRPQAERRVAHQPVDDRRRLPTRSSSAGTQRAIRPRSAMRVAGSGSPSSRISRVDDRAGDLEQLLGQEPRRGQPDLGQRHAEAGLGRRRRRCRSAGPARCRRRSPRPARRRRPAAATSRRGGTASRRPGPCRGRRAGRARRRTPCPRPGSRPPARVGPGPGDGSNASSSARSISASMALPFSGRSRVTVRTAPSTSRRTSIAHGRASSQTPPNPRQPAAAGFRSAADQDLGAGDGERRKWSSVTYRPW